MGDKRFIKGRKGNCDISEALVWGRKKGRKGSKDGEEGSCDTGSESWGRGSDGETREWK